MSDRSTARSTRGKINPFVFLPLIVVLAIFGAMAFLMFQPDRDASVIPSALIGRQAPETPLPAIPGLTGDDGEQLAGFDPKTFPDKPVLVNVWASWCGPCREEHPILMDLAARGDVTIAGLNYKDKTDKAAGFLGNLGNPYDMAGADTNGRAGIEWGVYGVPESFVVGPDGKILYKHVGPLTPQVAAEKILPLLTGRSRLRD